VKKIKPAVTLSFYMVIILAVCAVSGYTQVGFEAAYPAVVSIDLTIAGTKGTGVVIKISERGVVILTNRHVIWKKGVKEDSIRRQLVVGFQGISTKFQVENILYESKSNKPDIALLFLKVIPNKEIRSLYLSKVLRSRKGSRVHLIGYPIGSYRPQVYEVEIQDEDDIYYHFGLRISSTEIRGGASGSPLLDARGIVVGIVTLASGGKGRAIKYSVIRNVLSAWQINIPEPPEAERVAFPPIRVDPADDDKEARNTAKTIYKRMIYFLNDCGFIEKEHGDAADRLLDSLKQNIPGFWADSLFYRLPTKQLDAILDKKGDEYRVRFILKNVPDDGLLPVRFEKADKNIEKLSEESIEEFLNLFNIEVKFKGVRQSSLTKWSPWAALGSTGCGAVSQWQTGENQKDYDRALTQSDAEDSFTRWRNYDLARWVFGGLALTGGAIWLYSSRINPRRAEFTKINK